MILRIHRGWEGNATLHFSTELRSAFGGVVYPENANGFNTFAHDLYTDAAIDLI